jgi:spore maturation protein CgeB
MAIPHARPAVPGASFVEPRSVRPEITGCDFRAGRGTVRLALPFDGAGREENRLKIVIWGLTVSSSWGNGHATLWRGLIRALTADGHQVTFVEKDVPWYRDARDLHELPGGTLLIYEQWSDVLSRKRDLLDADALIVTSYCPDAVAATRLIEEEGRGVRVFYDLDTPVTLARLAAGEPVDYLPPEGLGGFDLVLSYTGGPALAALKSQLGARRALPLYGHVDPVAHRPASPLDVFRGDLSYLGTFADDGRTCSSSCSSSPRAAPLRSGSYSAARLSRRLPLATQHLVHEPCRAGRSRRVFLLVAADAERHAARYGGDGLVPVGPAVRSGGLRCADRVG